MLAVYMAGLVLCFVGFLSSEAQALQKKNLLTNGDFESGDPADFERSYDNSWVFFEITGDPIGTMDRNENLEGNQSYHFQLGKESRAFLHSQSFQVQPNETYKISAWIKAENATSESVFIRIFWFKDSIGIPASNKFNDTEKVGGSFEWRKVEQKVQAPSNSNIAYVRLEPNSGNLEFGGDKLFYTSEEDVNVWFDDIQIQKIDN